MFGLVAGIVATLAFAPGAHEAAHADPPLYDFPATTLVIRPIDHAITMSQAVTLGATIGEPVLAYRYENDEVIGEYTPSADYTPTDFDDEFELNYGTDAQVVAFVVERTTVVDADGNLATPDGAVVVSGLPLFVAPTGYGAANTKLDEFAKQGRDTAESKRAIEGTSNDLSATTVTEWRPDQVATNITRYGTHNYFQEFVTWFPGSSSPHAIPPIFGLEIGVDLYNNASLNKRPYGCILGYKDAFFAKDHGWNWSVLNSDYSPLPASVRAYADYNDLLDTCNRNNITIGIANPQNIPTSPNNGGYAMLVSVDAPSGTQVSNRIGGGIQLVDRFACAVSLGTTSLTDCMGAAQLVPTEVPSSRPTLAATRNWVAPDRCWLSDDFGTTPPYSLWPGSGC